MVATNYVTKKEGIYLGIDEVISATELAILAFLRKQHLHMGSFKPPRFSDRQLLELCDYADRVPFWKSSVMAQETIRKLRVDADFLIEVPALPMAIKSIHALAGQIEILGYVTMRPIFLYESSRAYLAKYDLPQAKLFMANNSLDPRQREQDRNIFIETALEKPRGIIEADTSLLNSLKDTHHEGRVFILKNMKNLRRIYSSENLRMPSFIACVDGWKTAVKEIQKWVGC